MSKHTLSFPSVVQARNAIMLGWLRTQMEDKTIPLNSPSQGLYNKPKSRVCLYGVRKKNTKSGCEFSRASHPHLSKDKLAVKNKNFEIYI
jgi:hypothetical protein